MILYDGVERSVTLVIKEIKIDKNWKISLFLSSEVSNEGAKKGKNWKDLFYLIVYNGGKAQQGLFPSNMILYLLFWLEEINLLDFTYLFLR